MKYEHGFLKDRAAGAAYSTVNPKTAIQREGQKMPPLTRLERLWAQLKRKPSKYHGLHAGKAYKEWYGRGIYTVHPVRSTLFRRELENPVYAPQSGPDWDAERQAERIADRREPLIKKRD